VLVLLLLLLLLLPELVEAGFVGVAVVPNPVVVGVAVVATVDFPDAEDEEEVADVEDEVVVVAVSPMEKEPLVAKTLFMLLMSTASRV